MYGNLKNVLIAALAGQVFAGNPDLSYFFILGGETNPSLVIERLDPVISPGNNTSNHVHSIVGGNGFNKTMDFAQTQTSTCSTFSVKADKSSYWFPNLYFAAKNGSFIRVPESPRHKFYYKYGVGSGGKDPDITEFPKEFRMITGNMFLRSDKGQGDSKMGGLQWGCHGNDTVQQQFATGIPKNITTCPGGLAASISFPVCWNGNAFNRSNPFGHMAFATMGDGLAGCPTTHRTARFPRIFLEYWFDTDTFDGLYTAQDSPFLLSMGDPTGYGFHADFVNGWQPGALNAAMQTCNRGNNATPQLSDPACFGNFSGTYTNAEMKACTQAPLTNEYVGWTPGVGDNGKTFGGVLSALPGCNPIQPGPQDAIIMTNCTKPAS